MKRLKYITTILLIILITISSTSALAYNKHNYNISFYSNLEDKAFNNFLKKLNIVGVLNEENLFSDNAIANGSFDINIKNKRLINFNHIGDNVYINLKSESIPPLDLNLNMHNFYEFMLKGYFFLGLPTQKVAVASYPYGLYSFYKLINQELLNLEKHSVNDKIPYKDLKTIANNISSLQENNQFISPLIRCLFIESGLSDNIELDLISLEEYFENFANLSDIEVKRSNTQTDYTLNNTTIFTQYTDTDKQGFELTLNDMPSEQSYLVSYTNEKLSNNTYKLRFDINISGYGETLYNLSINSDYLCDNTKNYRGNIEIKLYGNNVKEETHLINFDYNDAKINLDYLDTNKNNLFGLSIALEHSYNNDNLTLNDDYFDYEDDFFSLNDQKLADLKTMLKPYLRRLALPILLEVPFSTLNNIFRFIASNGILDLIIESR